MLLTKKTQDFCAVGSEIILTFAKRKMRKTKEKKPQTGGHDEVWKPIFINLLLLLVGYGLCRLAFWAENRQLFQLDGSEVWGVVRGGFVFDLAAISYTNALYLMMVVLPLHWKETRKWQQAAKVVFVVVNWLALIANLADAVYFPFVKRRTTASVFTEFANDNLTDIFGIELVNHWYLTVAAVALLAALWWGYRTPRISTVPRSRYYTKTSAMLILAGVAVFFGIRGSFDLELRPIHNGIAKEFVKQPANAALVVNTPFSITRTIGKKSYPDLRYFEEAELERIFTPEREMSVARKDTPDNIVILVLESFGSEYSKFLTPERPDEGFMPFLDSLMAEGLTYDLSLANGLKSIDAQVSTFASIPMMIEPFMSSQATMNRVEGMGNYLQTLGYETAYFHGADNGSLSIDGFVKSCGMEKYYGRTEYNNDDDWDHHWGIWDEPFLQFFGRQLGEMHEPFCAGVFTLTSHHPFRIPEAYCDTFPEGPLPIHRTIRYTDHSLRRFFEYARTQPWYPHTLFAITGDHTHVQNLPLSMNDLGMFKVPVFFYHPTDSTWRGHRPGIIQQIDLMPTILHHVGYQGRYFAFGNDLLDEQAPRLGSIAYIHDLYQLTEPDWLLQFDGERSTALYHYALDPYFQANLVTDENARPRREQMERTAKAFIQQYMTRMNQNRLTVLDNQPVRTAE